MWLTTIRSQFLLVFQVTWHCIETKWNQLNGFGTFPHRRELGFSWKFINIHLDSLAFWGQEDRVQSVIIPLELFSMANEASLREPPALDVSRKLLNHFAVDGFQSGDEPILIRLNQAWTLSLSKKTIKPPSITMMFQCSIHWRGNMPPYLCPSQNHAQAQVQNPESHRLIAVGDIYFLKGCARITTAVAAIVCINKLGYEVPTPLFWKSCQSVCTPKIW